MTDPIETLMTPEDLAKRWDVTTRTLDSYRRESTGPQFMMLGKKTIRYRMSDVLAHEERMLTGGELPKRADEVIRKAAGMFDAISHWKMRPDTHATIERMRDDLLGQLKQEA